jgi:hypothetical protein
MIDAPSLHLLTLAHRPVRSVDPRARAIGWGMLAESSGGVDANRQGDPSLTGGSQNQ